MAGSNYGHDMLRMKIPRKLVMKKVRRSTWLGGADQWDRNFIDLTEEEHITFEKKNRGELHFGAVDCELDCRMEKIGDRELIEFSFMGMDEGDEVSVRRWAVLDGDQLRGRIHFHDGEESGFTAGKL